MASVVRKSVTGIFAAAKSFTASGDFRKPSSMVRKATGWVTGIRERKGTLSPGGRVIGSADGAGGNDGMSLSFQPTGAPRAGAEVGMPAVTPSTGVESGKDGA